MNPALAVVVYRIPTCWNALAEHKKNPHAAPPASRKRLCVLLAGFTGGLPFFRSILSRTRMTGTRNTTAIQFRTARKVKAPTYSAPTLCATKADPQIAAQTRRASVCRSSPRLSSFFSISTSMTVPVRSSSCSYPDRFHTGFRVLLP